MDLDHYKMALQVKSVCCQQGVSSISILMGVPHFMIFYGWFILENISHRIHVWSILYANIWGIWMVNVTIYSSTMDPMGLEMDDWGVSFPCLAWPGYDLALRHEPSLGHGQQHSWKLCCCFEMQPITIVSLLCELLQTKWQTTWRHQVMKAGRRHSSSTSGASFRKKKQISTISPCHVSYRST